MEPLEFATWEEFWVYLFEEQMPEAANIFVRSWLIEGFTEEQIAQAILIAARKTHVEAENKLAYANGVLRNWKIAIELGES